MHVAPMRGPLEVTLREGVVALGTDNELYLEEINDAEITGELSMAPGRIEVTEAGRKSEVVR